MWDGGPPELTTLRERCLEINSATLRHARARQPRTPDEQRLALRVWEKVQADISAGRAGRPVDLSSVDLSDVLLVDVFGIWEQHGQATEPKVRDIHNFRSNLVNEYAWMPHRIKHDHFGQLVGALQVLYGALGQNQNGLELLLAKRASSQLSRLSHQRKNNCG